MDHDTYPDSYIAGILQEAKSFALVGASANTVRPSYFVLKYLLAKGYRVFPDQPRARGRGNPWAEGLRQPRRA